VKRYFNDCSEQQPTQQTGDLATAQTASPTTIYESIDPSNLAVVYSRLQIPESYYETLA